MILANRLKAELQTSYYNRLFVRNDHLLDSNRRLNQFAARKSGVSEHLIVFGESISVSAGRRREHGQREGDGLRPFGAVFVGDEVDGYCAPVFIERRMNLSHQHLVGRGSKWLKKFGTETRS